MELNKKFDVTVIGSNFSAYIAAAILAKRGLSTLLIDNYEAQYNFDFFGFKFDYFPQYSAGFYPERLFDKVFQELNLSIKEQAEITKSGATYQVITNSNRINITDKISDFKNEIEREFPNYSDRVLNFYNSVNNFYEISNLLLEKNILFPPSGFMEKSHYKKTLISQGFSTLLKFRTLNDLLKNFKLQGTDFEVFVKAQIYLFSYTYQNNPGFMQSIRILGNMMRRTCYVNGGYPGLLALLKKKVFNFGGCIKNDTYIDEFIYEKGSLSGIRLSSYEGIIYSKFILASMEINDFLNLCPKTKKPKQLKVLSKEYGLFTINIGLNETVIPVEMKDRFAYVVNDKKPLIEENLILCSISREKDEKKSPPEKRILSASCIVPYKYLSDENEKLVKIQDRIIFNLKKIIPFLEEHIVVMHPCKSKYFNHLNKNKITDECLINNIKVNPQFIYTKRNSPYLGITAIPNKTHKNNLFYTGREVLPDIGFEGEMFSCYKVINHITKRVNGKIASS